MPYWRLSSFYFFYFAALGALIPFWALYLKSLGFSALQIGELMAILTATKIVAPYLWGWLGDSMGRRTRLVRGGALLSLCTFLLVFWLTDYAGLALAMALFSFFWNAVLPQIEVITLRFLGSDTPQYSRIRVWGSVGFMLVVVVLGFMVDRWGVRVILPVLALLYAGIWLSTLMIPEEPREAVAESAAPLSGILLQPAILSFFIVCLLMQFSHGAYYTFFSIHLEAGGYTKGVIGQLWALGVAAEVTVYIFAMHKLLQAFTSRSLLLWCLLLAALRWILIALFSDYLLVLIVAQLLHAATFGAFHAAAIDFVHHNFPRHLQGRGQALYSSVSFGVGGTLGSLGSGLLWESSGATTTFLLFSASALVAMGVLVAGQKRG
ncbi:MAG: MFS transporter [Pseudomonadota bacterium]